MLPSLIRSSSGRPIAFVIVGDLDHQAQVGLDHLLARFLVALLDARGQFDLLLRREQLDLPDLAQVELDGRVAVIAAPLAAGRRHCVVAWNLRRLRRRRGRRDRFHHGNSSRRRRRRLPATPRAGGALPGRRSPALRRRALSVSGFHRHVTKPRIVFPHKGRKQIKPPDLRGRTRPAGGGGGRRATRASLGGWSPSFRRGHEFVCSCRADSIKGPRIQRCGVCFN